MPPKIYDHVNSLNSGELSELLASRDDIPQYKSGCRVLENAVPLVEGGAKKMPGTYFGGATDGNNKARLVPFQFSTEQGCFLELTSKKIRIWQNDVLLTSIPDTVVGYDPDTAYIIGDKVLAGPWVKVVWMSGGPTGGVIESASVSDKGIGYTLGDIVEVVQGGGTLGFVRVEAVDAKGRVDDISLTSGGSGYASASAVSTSGGTGSGLTLNIVAAGSNPSVIGNLYLAAPYGQDNATTVPVTVTVNGSDALAVTVTGAVGNQGINIALANATAASNTAALIQAAIRALVFLNSTVSNYIDLTGWIVTPDTLYYATPQIVAPATPGPVYPTMVDKVFIATADNQHDEFPPVSPAYWMQSSISVGSGVIELATPYREGDLFALDCSTQSADVLWIFHASYPPAVVERLGANLWQYSTSLPGQGPNEPPYRGTPDVVKTGYSGLGQAIVNVTQASPCVITVAAISGVFADGTRVYINGIAGGGAELNQGEYLVSAATINADGTFSFTPQDPDTGATIDSTKFTIPKNATPDSTGTTYTIQYSGGGFVVEVVALFSAAGDYPACACLYDQRLCVAGSKNNPTRMYGSVEGDYPNFICDPTADDYGVQFTLSSQKLDQVLSMIGTPNSMILGTAGGVWVMAGSNQSALSQVNVLASKQTTVGVGRLQPQLVNESAIFISRSSRIVVFLVYDFVSNQWNNFDLTRLNRNITIGTSEATSGIVQTSFQVEPYPIFWAVRADGQLLGLVFNKADQVFAWFRVNMTTQGGSVESVAAISRQGAEDEVAVVVKRVVNGDTVRYVEFFQPQELFGDLSNAFFVHCGQQWYGGASVAITGISNTNLTVVTAPGHEFVNGDEVQITGVLGMTEINQDQTEAYTVANANIGAGTFELSGMDSTGFSAYVSGGTVAKVTDHVTGMSYLIGNNAVAVGDGALIMEETEVTGDTVTLPYYSNLITIGIPYQTTIQPSNPVLGSPTQTTRGMRQKLSRVTISLYQSMGGKFGTDVDHLYDITYGPGTKAQVPAMKTLELTRDLDADWDSESTFIVTQSDPFPLTLRGIVLRMSYSPD